MLQEDKHNEFKQAFSEDVIQTLVAFANAKGGTVHIGRRDDGTPCGVTLGKETIQKWINEIKQKTEPSIIPDVDIENIEDKQVVTLHVQEYPVKPVSTRGRYYRRQANSNHLLSAVEIADMSLQTKNSSWDYYTDREHTIDDINLETVQLAINQMNRHGMEITEKPIDFLKKKELCSENGQLTYGSYLMFKKHEDIMTTIELGHFQDKEGILIKDSLRSKSNLVSQVGEVMSFIKKHINMAVEFSAEQTENIQKWDYPLEAIREIVLNMIIHRDYRSAADSVVKVLPDRIEFYNPGTLPDDISIEDLKSNNYSSRPRNKQVADVFKDMGEIEKYGSGIRRVVRMFTEAGHPSPEWKQISGGIMVTAWNANIFGNNETGFGNNEEKFGNNETDFGNNETGFGNNKRIVRLNEAQKDTYEYILEHKGCKTSDISNHFEKPYRTVYKHIQYLLELGLIERIGSRKNGGYGIKQ